MRVWGDVTIVVFHQHQPDEEGDVRGDMVIYKCIDEFLQVPKKNAIVIIVVIDR